MKDYSEMIVFIETTGKNSWQSATVRVEAGRIFNFDGIRKNLSAEQVEFLNSLPISGEFVPIPEELLDYTTAANWDYAIALTTPADFAPVEVFDI